MSAEPARYVLDSFALLEFLQGETGMALFYFTVLLGSTTKTARKTSRLAERQAQETQSAPSGGRKAACCGSNSLKLDW